MLQFAVYYSMTKQKIRKPKYATKTEERYNISTNVNMETKEAFLGLAKRMGNISEAALARIAISAFIANNLPSSSRVVRKTKQLDTL